MPINIDEYNKQRKAAGKDLVPFDSIQNNVSEPSGIIDKSVSGFKSLLKGLASGVSMDAIPYGIYPIAKAGQALGYIPYDKDTLDNLRQAYRETFQNDVKFNPVTNNVGEIAGFLIPMTGWGKAAKVGLEGIGGAKAVGRIGKMVESGISTGGVELTKRLAQGQDIPEATKGAVSSTGVGLGTALGIGGAYKAGKWAGGLLSKTVKGQYSSITGISQDVIDYFSKYGSYIKSKLKSGYANTVMEFTDEIYDKLKNYVSEQNQTIQTALKNVKEKVNVNPIVQEAFKIIKVLKGKKWDPDQLQAISELQNRINLLVEKKGNMVSIRRLPAIEIHELKQKFADYASRFYDKTSGIQPYPEIDKAFAALASVAREMEIKLGGASVKTANKNLEQMILNQKKLGIGNVFGKDAAEMAVGKIKNILERIDTTGAMAVKEASAVMDIKNKIGIDMRNKGMILKTIKQFTQSEKEGVSLLSTGKALLGPASGAAIGGGIGSLVGAEGAAAGAALGTVAGNLVTSPQSAPKVIPFARYLSKVVPPIYKKTLYGGQKLGLATYLANERKE